MQAQLRLDLPWRADCGQRDAGLAVDQGVCGWGAGWLDVARELEARLRFGHRNAGFFFPERCTFVPTSLILLLRLPSHFASSPQREHGRQRPALEVILLF